MSQHPALPYLRSSEKGKIVTATEAVRLIRDGDTIATGGFVGIGFAEEVALALEEFYLSSEGDAPYMQGKPRNVERGKNVLYITERCVFALRPDGLELTEVAPGIDIERDILAQMDFKPLIPRDPVTMDQRIFREGAMELREDMLTIPLDQRFTLDDQQNLFFVNLERFTLRSRADIDAIARAVETRLGGLNRRVYAIVNYDHFSIVPELLDEYSSMVRSLVDRFYSGVSRYTTSGFLRIKLGEALEKRGVAAHIFESAGEAQSDWRHVEGNAGSRPDHDKRAIAG